jgi:hypothetical protein
MQEIGVVLGADVLAPFAVDALESLLRIPVKGDRNLIAFISALSMISIPSFAPSASKPHDKDAKREQNSHYTHYNGRIR